MQKNIYAYNFNMNMKINNVIYVYDLISLVIFLIIIINSL